MSPCSESGSPSFQRPRLHFTADSWINDPCAPGYDQASKTYHLFYQCNPSSCEWGNMSWGHIVSKDMLNWKLASTSPALAPDQPYDSQGVFTGCWIPPDGDLDSTLRVAYSSVKQLPFHWSTPPYPRDAAGLAIATSHDGGNTWTKSPQNPVLRGEPAGLLVTGFRDPYVTESPSIDEVHGTGKKMLYGLISGGIEGVGPTTFLYEIQPGKVEDWRYLGPLVDMPLRFQPSMKWSGNYGVNWECTNILTLHAGSEMRDFLIIGAEGDVEKDHVRDYNRRRVEVAPRTVRSQLWMSGQLKSDDGGIGFKYEHGGYLDQGPYYAATSFLDTKSGRRIVHGWIPEEDIPLDAAKEKGWNGSLALPREIFLLKIPNVHGTLRSALSDISPFEVKVEPDGSKTIFTLGVSPLSEFTQLRSACQQTLKSESRIALPQLGSVSQQALFRTQAVSWELEATISVYPGCETVGFHFNHDKDLSIRTSVSFCAVSERIIVDREASNADSTVNKCPDAGQFTLLTRSTTNTDQEPALEKLQLRIFSDGDVLEVFANDRFALATMVYSERHDQDTGGVTAFATGSTDSAIFETVTVWDGLNLHRA